MKIEIENQESAYKQLCELEPGDVFFVTDGLPDPWLFIREAPRNRFEDGLLVETFNLKTNMLVNIGRRTKVILATEASLRVVAPYVLLYRPSSEPSSQTSESAFRDLQEAPTKSEPDLRSDLPPLPKSEPVRTPLGYPVVRTKNDTKIHTADPGADHAHCGQLVHEQVLGETHPGSHVEKEPEECCSNCFGWRTRTAPESE